MQDENRVTPEQCEAAMKQCEVRRPDSTYSRVRLLTAAVAAGNAVLPANSMAVAFSYALAGQMDPAFGGDTTASAAALLAAGNANGSDTDLNTARETDGDFWIDSFGLLPLPKSDAGLIKAVMSECFLDIAFNGKTVKRIPGVLAPGGGGLVGALESFTGAAGVAQTIALGGSNGVARPQAVFSWGGAPMLWRGGATRDKLTATLTVPRSVSVVSGGAAALLFDALIIARGVRTTPLEYAR